MIAKKLILTIPFILAFASGVLSLSEENPSNIVGWICFLCLIVYLVANQKGNLFWKLFSIAAGWLIFIGIRLFVIGLQELLLAEFSYDIVASLVGILVGTMMLVTGIALHKKTQKSFIFAAIISVLFLTSAVNSYLNLNIPISELPYNLILRIVIWLSIIALLVFKAIKKLEPTDNL